MMIPRAPRDPPPKLGNGDLEGITIAWSEVDEIFPFGMIADARAEIEFGGGREKPFDPVGPGGLREPDLHRPRPVRSAPVPHEGEPEWEMAPKGLEEGEGVGGSDGVAMTGPVQAEAEGVHGGGGRSGPALDGSSRSREALAGRERGVAHLPLLADDLDDAAQGRLARPSGWLRIVLPHYPRQVSSGGAKGATPPCGDGPPDRRLSYGRSCQRTSPGDDKRIPKAYTVVKGFLGKSVPCLPTIRKG